MPQRLTAVALASALLASACSEPANSEPAEPESTLAQAGAAAVEEAAAVNARGARELGWEELMPEGEEERLAELYQRQMAMLYSGIMEGAANDIAQQFGTFNTVPELDGVKVRIPGYTVPFEYGADAKIREFLLVPYYGACLHAPPPPPNQTLFISTDDAITLKDLAMAVWIEGTLKTERQDTELAGAAYTIVMDRIEPYEY
ncbi:MAG: DUF3299 domain-containing protein [Pseudomonadota bacterium]